ncbi:MAG: DUF3179 domain-containing protein [SAR324 cluster bacterium]|nr:DUF3179 domain-containing protein [SAR324 cluster bacterium]
MTKRHMQAEKTRAGGVRCAGLLAIVLAWSLLAAFPLSAQGGGAPGPPPVERRIHSVPLEQVVFDTFDGAYLRLSEADDGDIARLRDAIRPIYQPRYEGPGGGDWLKPQDLVIGYAGRAGAYAYPLKILNYHEIVNDVIDGVPVLVSYCPLCASGIVFGRRLEHRTLLFGNTSALYENDMVMYDHQTGSYWFQVGGRAIVGRLTHKQLTVLPSMTLPWREWLALHPATRVLSREQGFGRRPPYQRDAFQGYARMVDALRFPFPLSMEKVDRRLRAGAVVLSVRAGGRERAYPLARLGDAAVNDSLGGLPVVIMSRASGPWAGAFVAMVNGRRLDFRMVRGAISDIQTGSRWNMLGHAEAGPLAGKRLRPLPTRRAFWFSLSLALPGIELYQP